MQHELLPWNFWGSQKSQQFDLLPQVSPNSKVTFFENLMSLNSGCIYNKALFLYSTFHLQSSTLFYYMEVAAAPIPSTLSIIPVLKSHRIYRNVNFVLREYLKQHSSTALWKKKKVKLPTCFFIQGKKFQEQLWLGFIRDDSTLIFYISKELINQ